MASPTPLRRELLVSLGILFTGATLFLAAALMMVLPLIQSPGRTVAFVFTIVLADLLTFLAFGGWMLKKGLLEPVQALVQGVGRISDGDYQHRLELPDGLEFRSITEGVNVMADRLIADQQALADNVESLDYTNMQLVEARNEVIQAARLVSVGTLAAGIAHEVGNPLAAIIGYVDVAVRRLKAEGADPELLLSIRSEAQRIDGIVRGLLDYARPKPEEVGPIQVREVVGRVRDLLENQGRLIEVEHRWYLDEECPPVLVAEQHLEQVLVNLVLNALDALASRSDAAIAVAAWTEDGRAAHFLRRRESDPPGINYLHRRRVAVDSEAEVLGTLETARRVVVITVSDNGPGLPESDLDNVFDPFFTTKEPGRGTGLGLFLSARLVGGMGGRIEVENQQGGGARFTVRLPEAIAAGVMPAGIEYSGSADRQEVE